MLLTHPFIRQEGDHFGALGAIFKTYPGRQIQATGARGAGETGEKTGRQGKN